MAEPITKDLIFGFIDDAVVNFIYYDRKNCEQLPTGAIEQAIKDGVITVPEIVAKFKKSIEDGLSDG